MRIASKVSVRVPIWLTLTRIELATPSSMPAPQPLRVGDEEVVADQLGAVAEALGEQLPAVPVLLVHAVLDRDHRIAGADVVPVGGHLLRRERAALVLQRVGAVLEELAGGGVEGDVDVGAGLVAGGGDAGEDGLQGRLVRLEVGGEAPLVADRRRQAPGGEALLQRVEDLDADPQALREARRAGRDDHELLEVDRVVGVGAAVEDVHHRHRQHGRLAAAVELGQIAVERLAGVGRGGLRHRQRDAEDRVGAEPALVRGAVELDHRPVQGALLGPRALQGGGDLAVDVRDRRGDPLAGPGVPPVAQLDGLELAGRGAGGHRRQRRGRPTRARPRPRPSGLPRESMIWRAWMRSIALKLIWRGWSAERLRCSRPGEGLRCCRGSLRGSLRGRRAVGAGPAVPLSG